MAQFRFAVSPARLFNARLFNARLFKARLCKARLLKARLFKASKKANDGESMDDPTSIMLPLYEGRSCMSPGYNYTSTCEQGGYPSYAVNVSNVAQIQLAVNFARNANLRLVVKNTGHDFNGKASGKGALTVWTHWLQDKAFYPIFEAANGYVGPAIKFGAGVQVGDAFDFAKTSGVTVVGGEAVTVSLAGGYTAGGGHSPLSSTYGLAADQVLAMEGCTTYPYFLPSC